MSRDPESGSPLDPKTLQKYLYVSGDPVNLIDPRGRSILETGSIDLEIGTGPLPALTDLAGGAFRSAASTAIDGYLAAARVASSATAAVGDFIEAVDWAELTKGITKELLCESLQIFLESKIEEYTGELPPNIDLIDRAEEKFQEVCWELAGKVPLVQ
jgi:hypothetical protein